MGAVVAIIGLELAPVAAQMAGLAPWPTPVGQTVAAFTLDSKTITVSLFTLVVGILGSVLFKGFLQVRITSYNVCYTKLLRCAFSGM